MSKHLDINFLFHKYYSDNPELRRIVTTHSAMVAKKALEICRNKNLPLDHKLVFSAAMVHDIGVVNCNAPEIHAHGKQPYILHGLEGKKILQRHGLKHLANVCTNHTGAGITAKEIEDKNLPLPHQDFLPKNLLEKLICYADKFYSKSHDLTKEKTIEEISAQMKRHGEESYKRFMELHSIFT